MSLLIGTLAISSTKFVNGQAPNTLDIILSQYFGNTMEDEGVSLAGCKVTGWSVSNHHELVPAETLHKRANALEGTGYYWGEVQHDGIAEYKIHLAMESVEDSTKVFEAKQFELEEGVLLSFHTNFNRKFTTSKNYEPRKNYGVA